MNHKHQVPVVFYKQGERWLAQSIGPDVATFGDSFEAARLAITEALELYFEDEAEVAPVSEVRLETVLV